MVKAGSVGDGSGANASLSRRHLFGMGGGLAATGLLAACGSNTGRETSGGTGSGGKAVVNQWYHQYGEAGTEQAVQRYAEEYPGADVQVSWKLGDYDQSTAASLLTASGPDVFEYGNGATIDMIKAGQVADLTDLLGDTRSDFNQAILDRMTYQGKVYAIPQVVDFQLLVYRKSLLAKAGVMPPKTVDELVAAAAKLTQGKTKGLFLGNDGGAGNVGILMLWSAGFDYLTKDGSFGFDDPKAAQALGVLRKLFTSGDLLLGAPKDWFDASALVNGLTAMQFTGFWTFPDLAKKLGDDFGCIPWPAGPGGKQSVIMGAYGSCVNARSKNVAAAKEFVKWLWIDQTDKQVDFATSYGAHMPARTSLLAKADLLKKAPFSDATRYASQYGRAQVPILWTPKCRTAFSDMMNRIIRNGADPMTEIRRMKPIVEAELKRVKG